MSQGLKGYIKRTVEQEIVKEPSHSRSNDPSAEVRAYQLQRMDIVARLVDPSIPL